MLKDTAEATAHDADMFRRLLRAIQGNKTIFHNDFVIMSYDAYNEILNKSNLEEDKLKELQAELEWYKVRYHEMKMKVEDRL